MVTYLSGVQEPLVRVQIPHPDLEEVIAMIKRLVCLLSAVMVTASSVFAWDAYSFTGVYDASSIPNLVLADTSDSGSVYSVDLGSGVPSIYADSDTPTTLIAQLHARGSYSYPGASGTTLFSAGEVNGSLSSFVPDPGYFGYGITDYTLSYRDHSFNNVRYVDFYCLPIAVTYDIPVPSGDYTSMEISASFHNSCVQIRDPAWGPDGVLRLEVVIDGIARESILFSERELNYSDIFHFTSTPSSIQLRLLGPLYTSSNGLPPDGDESGSLPFSYFMFIREDSSLTCSFLGANAALDGDVNQAQGDLDDLESVESEWTGSMTSNFDALDLGNFSFPSGLVSGFSLITGIFQDLWNSMGEYKILFVFPLTLGVVLLLIGRISKFSGGHSSRSSGRSDDA